MAAENSTIVRLEAARAVARRLGLRVAAAFAPDKVDRYAADLFRTPRRSRPPSAPSVPLYVGKPFVVDGPAGPIRAWQFGQGPTVVVAHGWNGASTQLVRLIARIVGAGFEVVAFDQPAHGLSSGTRTDVAGMADAVRSVVFRVRPVHAVVAHSLGATATALAMASGAAIPRAVFIAPPIQVPCFIRAFAARLGLPPERAEGMRRRLEEVIGDMAKFDLLRHAPLQRAPLLVLHDRQDREVPFEHGAALAAAWPGARLQPLANLGHRRMLREPRVLEEIVDFLREGARESLQRIA